VSRQDIERKFTSNVAALLEQDSVDRLRQLAEQLDLLPNANELNEIMAAPLKNAKAHAARASSVEEVE
jgi:hypothetical protein